MISNIYYTSIALLAIIIHLIINLRYLRSKDNRPEVKEYKTYLQIIFCYYLTDAAWGWLNEAKNIPLLYFDTILYYISMAFSVVFCSRYIMSYLRLTGIMDKIISKFVMLFGFIQIIVLIINHFHHIFFWFDESGNYEAKEFRYIALIIQFIIYAYIFITSLIVVVGKTGIKSNRSKSICLFAFCMTLALVLQTAYPLLPLYSVGLMLGTLIVHTFIHSEEQMTQLIKIEELNSKLMNEQKTLKSQKDEIATAFGIIDGLSHDYHSIWRANKEDMKIQLVREPSLGAIPEAVKMAFEYADCDEALKKYVEQFVVKEDQERILRMVNSKVVLEELEKTDFYAVNFVRRTADGHPDYNQLAFANADTVDGKRQLVFGFRDVNDILKQEQALRKEISDAKNAAEAANAAKTSFLFNMSHDIRTPMNAIIGFRDLLEKYQDDPAKRADYLKKIEDSSNVLLSIINNVLEMARIEKGVLEINESPWSAEQMLDSLYSVFEDMMVQKGLEFTREIKVENHYIFCDLLKIREVFINILSNAYKYTPAGGKIHMSLEEIASDKEGYAKYRTTITDTGIGMSEEFLPHLFEEFSREQNSTQSKIEGTGLGMPIVKRLVDIMGGTIEVKSKKGEGTSFVITINHRITDKSKLTENDSENQTESFEQKRILLVEDNELNAEIAIEILSEIGFTVERAVNGEDCLDKIKTAEPCYYDLILMDIQMPVMNGYEATKAIRALDDKEKSQVKILAMTANAFEEDKREALKAGMNGHLAKPINIKELTKVLSNNFTTN